MDDPRAAVLGLQRLVLVAVGARVGEVTVLDEMNRVFDDLACAGKEKHQKGDGKVSLRMAAHRGAM